MSAFVVSLVFKSPRITKLGELCALLAIADEANDDGFSVQQRKYLAKKSRLTERAFSGIIGRFLKGENPILSVVIGGGRGRVSQYQIDVGAPLQSVKTGNEKQGNSTQTGNDVPGLEKETSYNTLSSRERTRAPTREEAPPKSKRFRPPSLDEVKDFFEEIGASKSDAKSFFYHYDSVDWTVGKTSKKMSRWKSSARGWVLREKKFGDTGGRPKELTRSRPKPLNRD